MHYIPLISIKLGLVSIPKRRTFSPLFLFCAYSSSVLQNFKIFTPLLPHFSYGTILMTEVYILTRYSQWAFTVCQLRM